MLKRRRRVDRRLAMTEHAATTLIQNRSHLCEDSDGYAFRCIAADVQTDWKMQAF
ncbi:hypothetical protein D3C72_2509330 [compost metagenome]